MRQLLPPWMPSIGLEGGRINIVPVDFVVDALDHISHKTDLDKRCFHLVDPVGYRVGDVLDIFSRAAHAPKMNLFVNAALLGFIPKSVKKGLMALAPVRRITQRGDEGPGPARGHADLRQLPDPLRQPRDAGGAQGLGHRMPEPEGLRLAALGLLGAPSRPRPAHRPLAARHGGRQGGAGHRRLVRHRPGGGAQVRRGRRDHHHLRAATRTSWSRRSARSSTPPAKGCDRRDLPGRHRRHGRAATASSTG